MSASSKKKQRNEQAVAKLTEKQLAERKEAKQLKLYTTIFICVLALLLVSAIGFGIYKSVDNSGVLPRSTTALTIGSDKLNNVELSYFYSEAIQNYVNSYGQYLSLMGLDPTKPLNEQISNPDTGATWADDFLEMAKQQAASVYGLCNAANAAGHTLSQEEQSQIDSYLAELTMYAAYYGYPDAQQYIRAMYGKGADEESLRAFLERNTLAQSYSAAYGNSLTYTPEQLAARDAEDPLEFNSYSYNSYYVATSSFYEGGTTGEDGRTTYSDEEKAAAAQRAEEAAKALCEDSVTSLEELDDAIAAMPTNAQSETPVTSTAHRDTLRSGINSTISSWVTDKARAEGDMTYLPSSTTQTAEDGTETTTVNGYYVVYYVGMSDNKYPLVNVRHILVSFEGGTSDGYGGTVYPETSKVAAKVKAEELLAQWQGGKASEETFAEMAKEHSTDPGSAEKGGLYEDVYPGQMVAAFNDWCFDDHKVGDTGIVETEYGYHVLYFSGNSDTLFRDYMIKNALANADYEAWYQDIVQQAVASMVSGDTKYLPMNRVISAQS